MNNYAATTVPTPFVEANGIRFAFRRWGKQGGIPLVFNQHFTGNLDNWDPAVLDGLATEREVILFNNAGVASSTGEVPNTFAGMAKNAEAFTARSVRRTTIWFTRKTPRVYKGTCLLVSVKTALKINTVHLRQAIHRLTDLLAEQTNRQ